MTTSEIKDLINMLAKQSIQHNKTFALACFSLFCFSVAFHCFVISANFVSLSDSWALIPAEIALLLGCILSFVHMRQWIRTLKENQKKAEQS
ncbi:MAG: hypothetical protein WCJ51_02915 [Candidatus Moraniibacteriota bacterium]